ncbi:hypothetical protein ACHQM5_001605 [Ranunculus cassubicifolius]
MEAVLLESRLENLIFHFLSFDFFTLIINSVWTWAAVLTAALSFWRIQTARAVPPAKFQYQPCQNDDAEVEKDQQPIESQPPTTSASCDLRSCICDGEVDATTKRKFSVYLGEESLNVQDDWEFHSEDDNCFMVDEIFVGNVCSWDSFEFMFVKKNGDCGWYRHQDMSALDGRVVKLWEAERQRGVSLVQW